MKKSLIVMLILMAGSLFVLSTQAIADNEKEKIDEIVAGIKDKSLKSNDPELLKLGEKAGPFIEPLTDDKDSETRLHALIGLHSIGYNVVPNILKQFDGRPMGNFDRTMYFEMLYGHKSEDVKKFLLSVFRNQNIDFTIRQEAMSALSDYRGDTDVLKTFSDAYNKEGEQLKEAVVAMLGLMKNENSFKLLSTALKDNTAEIRARAVISLGMLGGDNSAKTVSKMLKDKDSLVRDMAVRMLGFMRAQKYIGALEKIAKDDKDSNIKWIAGSVVEKIKRESGAVQNSRVDEIDLVELMRVDPVIHKAEYEAIVKKVKALQRTDWPLLIRRIDDICSTFIYKSPDEWEGAGWAFLSLYRPLAQIDEVYAREVHSATIPDKTYSFLVRSIALEDHTLNKEELQKIVDDPTEYPEFKTAVAEALNRKK